VVTVTICDVGPRDGLQNEPETLAPSVRAELVSRLAAARVPRVEAVSFVRDELVPQMAGAEEVVAAAERRDGTELSGLVLNERGYERFAQTTLDRINCTLAATESFNRRNGNAMLDEAVERVRAIATAARVPVTVTVSCAWGCPFEGEVDPAVVADLCERLAGDELVLADTIGVATPRRVQRLVERVSILGKPVGAHLHNTRNTGYAGAWGALEGGATVLDASVGGLGGCPFSPQATGNVATEDLVWQLERDGVRTGVDVDALIASSRWLEGLLGRRLEGSLYRAAPWPSA
jgi:hydroxymethylglutaryl-CoA lyase/(R)-citramalyl-CoA lyase